MLCFALATGRNAHSDEVCFAETTPGDVLEKMLNSLQEMVRSQKP